MSISFVDINTYECQIRALKSQIADFESGKAYQKLEEVHLKDMAYIKKENKTLLRELNTTKHQLENNRKHWLEVIDDIEKKYKAKLKQNETEKATLRKRIITIEQQRDEALNKLKDLKECFENLSIELEEYQEKNIKLRAQLNRDYENSSIPSSKSVNRKKIANGREKTTRKPGAQPGHPHHTRKMQTPTSVVKLPAPSEVIDNPDFKKTGKEVVKQLVSISLVVNTKEYHADVYYNCKTKKYKHAAFPQGVTNDVNYDGSIKAFLYLLNNDCCTSIDKCSKFLYDLTGGKLKISKGMINKLSKTFSDKTKKEFQDAFNKMIAAPVMHTDCTNANVNGNPAYVFICAVDNGEALYFAREHKGHKGVAGTVTENYQGILVHDHESTFNKYGSSHQECLAHVSRYLKDSIDNEPTLIWNASMRNLLKEMIHYRKSIPQDGNLDYDKVVSFEKKYDDILDIAEKEYNDSPPRKSYREGYNLQKRMRKYKEKHLLFLHDRRVPTTNNLAERMLRVFKRKQAQATVFRSFDSINYLCGGMSMLYLMRQKDETNVFKEVGNIFNK